MEFLATCESNRLLGVLAEAVRAGAVVFEGDQREVFERSYRFWLAHDLQVEHLLLRAADVLDVQGIDFRVLKGVALAHTVYPDPSMRVFGDVDLLVASQDFVRVAELLARRLGGTRELPELRPGFDDRFGREILLRVGSVELDIHRTLVDGPFGLGIPLGDLLADPVEFELGGRRLRRVSDPARFLHVCYAAALGDWPPRLIAQRDLALLLGGPPGVAALDADSVLEMARRWGATAVVAAAVRRAVSDLDLRIDHPLVAWAAAHRPRPKDRLMLRSYRGRARGYTSQAMSVLVLSGFRDRFDYLRAIVRPSAAYMAARGFRRGDRVAKVLGLRMRRR